MTNPLDMHFARSGVGYVGLWDRGGVEISIDHLRRRSGELHGEIVVSAAVVGAGYGKLHRASFNLSSTTSRDRLAKMLTARSYKQELAWDNMLEAFCAAVLEAERAGTPIIRVGDLPPFKGESYLVDPFLPAGKTTILYAAGGTGKSYLAVLLAVAVATGHSVLDWRVRPGRVLYLDWETDAYEVDERIKRVAAGLGVPAPEILYRPCMASLEDMAEGLARSVSDERIELVVVDSIGMASGAGREGGDANESALRLFTGLRHINTTVLAIDHITGEDVKLDKAVAKPYGSIYKVNLARSVWELRRAAEGDDVLHLGLYHRKVNKGRLQPAIGLRVEHFPASTTFDLEELQDENLVRGLTQTAQIDRLLMDGPMSLDDLSEAMGRPPNHISAVISKDKGRMFTRLPSGLYARAHRGPQPVAQPVARSSKEVA